MDAYRYPGASSTTSQLQGETRLQTGALEAPAGQDWGRGCHGPQDGGPGLAALTLCDRPSISWWGWGSGLAEETMHGLVSAGRMRQKSCPSEAREDVTNAPYTQCVTPELLPSPTPAVVKARVWPQSVCSIGWPITCDLGKRLEEETWAVAGIWTRNFLKGRVEWVEIKGPCNGMWGHRCPEAAGVGREYAGEGGKGGLGRGRVPGGRRGSHPKILPFSCPAQGPGSPGSPNTACTLPPWASPDISHPKSTQGPWGQLEHSPPSQGAQPPPLPSRRPWPDCWPLASQSCLIHAPEWVLSQAELPRF